MNRLFIDSDILIDVFGHRDPHFGWAVKLLSMIENNDVPAATSAIVVANVYYIIRRLMSLATADLAMHKLLAILPILSVGQKNFQSALATNYKDFEDAIQWDVALTNKMTHFITRNKKDFPAGPLIVCTAEEYLAHLVK